MFYFCFHIVFNRQQVVNQLFDFHRGRLVLVVHVGKKAPLDLLYVALISCYLIVYLKLLPEILLKLFLFCLCYRAGLERR